MERTVKCGQTVVPLLRVDARLAPSGSLNAFNDPVQRPDQGTCRVTDRLFRQPNGRQRQGDSDSLSEKFFRNLHLRCRGPDIIIR